MRRLAALLLALAACGDRPEAPPDAVRLLRSTDHDERMEGLSALDRMGRFDVKVVIWKKIVVDVKRRLRSGGRERVLTSEVIDAFRMLAVSHFRAGHKDQAHAVLDDLESLRNKACTAVARQRRAQFGR